MSESDPKEDQKVESKSKQPILSFEQIEDLRQNLLQQKDQVLITVGQLQGYLDKVQTAIRENDQLRVKSTQLMSESYTLFLEEWKRKSEYFPDLRYQIILKAAESVEPRKR